MKQNLNMTPNHSYRVITSRGTGIEYFNLPHDTIQRGHLLEAGTDIRYIQSLLGHQSGKTTEIYTHITTKGFEQIKSPLDKLEIN